MSTVPPAHSNDAEIAVLHSMLVNAPQCLPVLLPILTEDCFYKLAHKAIFAAILSITQRDDTVVNLLTVNEELHAMNALEDAGGIHYLVSIARAFYPPSEAEAAGKIVFEKYGKRCLRAAGQEQEKLADDPSTDMFDVLGRTEAILDGLRDKIDKMKATPTMFSLSRESFNKMANAAEGEIFQTGAASGFHDLDEITGCFTPGDLIILAARPSMGKTAFALNVARYAASDGAVGIFSLEMSARSLYNRILSAETGVSGVDIKRNRLSFQEQSALVAAHGILAELPIIIDETAGTSLQSLKAKAKRMKRENNIQLLVVDYLQLITPPKTDNREQQISIISRNLKVIAKELQIPVIALSQLNREVEKRPDKRPHLSDLRESGSLEQDADIVLFINRLEQYGIENYEDGSPTAGTAEVIVAKNREGELGSVKLTWEKQCTRFRNYEVWQHSGLGT